MERQSLVRVVPPLLWRGGKTQLLEPLKSSGYEVSPTIATVSMFQMMAFVVYAIAPSTYVMATVSNTCYMGAGLYRAIIALTRGHSSAFLLGQLAGASFVYVFLGSSSFAFHAKSVMRSPAHSFDILGGWLLVLHVCFVCVAVCVIALVKRCTRRASDTFAVTTTQILLSTVLVGGFTMLMTFYDFFYGKQLELYFVLGPSAAVFGSICRFMLVYEKGALQWRAVRIAMFELVVALTIVFSAILCQGELLSLTKRTLSTTTEGGAYDLYHAHWHYFLAVSTATLYSRAADASRVVMGTHRVCVCAQSWLDVGGLTALFFYSVTAVVLKENRVATERSLLILFGFNALLMLHAMLTLMDWMKRRR
jgi:hypothetical protein